MQKNLQIRKFFPKTAFFLRILKIKNFLKKMQKNLQIRKLYLSLRHKLVRLNGLTA